MVKCCAPRVKPRTIYDLLSLVDETAFPKVHTSTRVYARSTFAFHADGTTYQLHSGHYTELNDRYIAIILVVNPDVISVNSTSKTRLREVFPIG